MLSFFDSIVDSIKFAIDFLINTIHSIISLFLVVGQSLSIPAALQGIIPPILYASMMMFLAITIVRLICGR